MLVVVGDFARAFRVVDDQVDGARAIRSRTVGRTVGDFVDRLGRDARLFERGVRSAPSQPAYGPAPHRPQDRDRLVLLLVGDGNRNCARGGRSRRADPAADKPLRSAPPKLVDSRAPRRSISSRAPGPFRRRASSQTRRPGLSRPRTASDRRSQAVRHVAQFFAQCDPRRGGDEVDPCRFRDDRDRPARARIGFDDVEFVRRA